ncbi:MAG: hypothetical protein ACKVZH_15050 [Blastocatellia bacterium]
MATVPVLFNRKFTTPDSVESIEFTANAANDVDVMAALASPDQPFPNRQIVLGQITAQGDAGKAVKFPSRGTTVSFKASGSAFASLGVYPNPAALLEDLKLDDKLSPGIKLVASDDSNYLAIQWGYDINASAKGKVALGAGAFTFGGSASSEGLYAVIRRLPKTMPAVTAIGELTGSWLLPMQVDSADKLEPGTWLVAEIDGSIGVKLGAQFGYDLNWVRETALGQLKGDIGLRVQLGVGVALGFSASGKYALVISRDSMDEGQKILRLRLFKQRQKGWNFALNADASVTPVNELLAPEQFDDFVASVFGTSATQTLKYLHIVEKWTDPNTNLADQITSLSADYLRGMLSEVTAIADVVGQFNEAKQTLVGFLKKWDAMPQKVSSLLVKLVGENKPLAELRDAAKQLAGLNEATAPALLKKLLGNPDFFNTVTGQWLTAATGNSILAVLNNTQELKGLRDIAQQTSDILDGSTLEGVLTRLQKFINKSVHLDQIQDAINAADVNKLDQLLRARLSDFLGKELQLDKLKEIREAITTLLGKRQEYFAAAQKALTQKYKFSFDATYQKTTTNNALLDMEFDFAQAGVGDLLKAALDGDFDLVMTEAHPGVKLNVATISHGIKRQSHVELTLPYFNTATDHINTSMAQVSAHDDGGRILVYELDAKDQVVERNKRISQLTVGANWQLLAGTSGADVSLYNQQGVSYSYSFRQANAKMRPSELQFQLTPYIKTYFPDSFGADGAAPFDTWIRDLDKSVDNVADNDFENILINFEASVPQSLMSAWLKAPKDKKDQRYRQMSRSLQAAMRKFLTLYFFSDLRNYRDNPGAANDLLVYSSLLLRNQLRLDGDKLVSVDNGSVYWDWPSQELREAMIRVCDKTVLVAQLQVAHDLLQANGMSGIADNYHPSRMPQILREVITRNTVPFPQEGHLTKLLRVEAIVIEEAVQAGTKIASFVTDASNRPTKAVEALADYGSKITDAFNDKISSIYAGGGKLRPLGTAAMIEAARALDPTQGEVKASALLDLIFVKRGASFRLDDFLKGNQPDKNDVTVQQRLVSL